jgi:hypothetical protein
MNVDIGASVIFARQDTSIGLPLRDLITPFILQMASREVLPNQREALVKLTLGLCQSNPPQEVPVTMAGNLSHGRIQMYYAKTSDVLSHR